MPLSAVLLALGAMQAAASPAPSMVVTKQQLASSLPICRDQLARPHGSGDELVAAGWAKAIGIAPDGKSAAVATYRHPQNMLLLSLLDFPDKPDQCVIMVPFGPELDPKAVIEVVSTFADRAADRAGGWPTWQSASYDIRLEPMATAGAQLLFTKKGSE